MTIHVRYQSAPWAAWTTVNITTQRLFNLKLSQSSEHPHRLTWSMIAPGHTMPIPGNVRIQMWDTEGTNPLTSAAFDSDDPTFDGWVEAPQPKGSLQVDYVAFDPTKKCTSQFRVMSFPWAAGNPGAGAPPERGFGAIPRIVFNAYNNNDDDAAHQRAFGITVGSIIATLLDDQYWPANWVGAAPGDGVTPETPYVWASELAALDMIPQDKLVFQEETLRSAITRVLNHYPAYRMIWYPGEQLWRFFNLKESPQVTLTLNQFDGVNDVLTMDITRSIEGRHTAVKFYGPASTFNRVATTADGSLVSIAPSPVVLLQGVPVENKWQIADANFRKVARYLATPLQIPGERASWANSSGTSYTTLWIMWYYTQFPFLQARWNSNAGGDDEWYTLTNWYLDPWNGIITLGENYLYRWNPGPASGDPNVEVPLEIRFVYGAYTDPLMTRYPASGYEGTAYTLFGVATEDSRYDEMLQVATILGQSITTPTRVAQYTELARRIHEQEKDVVYAVSTMLDGRMYDFWGLNRRINVAAVDAAGNPLATGWEAINAYVTDVEYDYSMDTTVVQCSSDQMQLMGLDVEQEKANLKIRALVPRYIFNWTTTYTTRAAYTDFGNRIIGQDVHTSVDVGLIFIDPITGLPG